MIEPGVDSDFIIDYHPFEGAILMDGYSKLEEDPDEAGQIPLNRDFKVNGVPLTTWGQVESRFPSSFPHMG